MKSDKKRSSNKRAVVSIALFIMFILLPVSGMMIGPTKENLVATHVWGGIHCLLGLAFAVFGTFHIVYNWKALKHYLKRK